MSGKLIELDETNHGEIEALLLGRRIVTAEQVAVPIPDSEWPRTADGVLTLDDGTRIYVRGNEGGCACSAGDYPLTHLAAVDNVITSVRFEDRPDSDDYWDGPEGERGWYRIFVVADAVEVNVASFEGTDGNGYYGTGYELYVQRAPDAGSSRG
jgi:hypothetical protein